MMLVYNFECGASSITSTKEVLQGYFRDTSFNGEYLTSIVVRLYQKVISYRSTLYHVEERDCGQRVAS